MNGSIITEVRGIRPDMNKIILIAIILGIGWYGNFYTNKIDCPSWRIFHLGYHMPQQKQNVSPRTAA